MKSWKNAIAQHQGVMSHLGDLLEVHFDPAVALLTDAIKLKGKIMICGNGGSAAHAQHMAAELVVRYRMDRPALPAIALCADSATVTAGGNDFGYEDIFARQVRALARPQDLLVAFSTSGNSQNVLEAIRVARNADLQVLGLSGLKGMKGGNCIVDLNVPSIETARIQEAHTFLIHALVAGLEEALYGAA